MKRICYLLLFVLAGCSGSKENNAAKKEIPVSKNYITVLSPRQNDELTIGENVFLQLSANDSIAFDSIVCFLNDKLLITEYGNNSNFIKKNITLATDKTGTNTLKIISYFNNEHETDFVSLHLLSDIIPVNKKYTVINTYKHGTDSYTQGLVYKDGYIYEGTGNWGKSRIMKYKPDEHKILNQVNLSSDYFGEGIEVIDDNIYQITWRSQKGFVYDKNTFEKTREFRYPYYEGWGLTYDGTNLLMTDGTNKVYFLDKNYFSEIKTIEVYDNNGPVKYLNELEFVNGTLYANVYQKNYIVGINTNSGKVIEKIDLSDILPEKDKYENIDVLNGMAYNPEKNTWYITGKNWPVLFEIRVR